MERWQPDFDVYFTQIEDRPASFVLDLAAGAHAPVATHGLRLGIRIPMKLAREDGLRDGAELAALSDLEDRFVSALEKQVDAIYVGRVVHGGHTTLYFYVPEAHREALADLPAITGDPGDYEPMWAVADDAAWGLYLEFLSPGPYDAQSIWNRRLIQVFTEKGDRLETAREIDHVAFFPDREHAEQAAVALAEIGFRTDEIEAPANADDAWSLQFHRDDRLSEGRPDEFVGEILDIILDLEGDYDGWGAPHVE
jgi:regulator of RNase E activity RraB